MTSVAVPSPMPRVNTVASHPVRAAISALVIGACASVVVVLLAHRFGALHLPVHGFWYGERFSGVHDARETLIILGAALLSLVVPLIIAARQVLLRRRARPYLFAAAVGPVVVAAICAVMFLPYHAITGCCIH